MMRITYVPAHHLDRERIALRGPHGRHVAAGPRQQPGNPQPKSNPDCGRDGAVGIATARAAFAGRIGFPKRTMNRRSEPRDPVLDHDVSHQSFGRQTRVTRIRRRTPIDKPNTIGMRRWKPPAMSPNEPQPRPKYEREGTRLEPRPTLTPVLPGPYRVDASEDTLGLLSAQRTWPTVIE
jgi:hypothetical protein